MIFPWATRVNLTLAFSPGSQMFLNRNRQIVKTQLQQLNISREKYGQDTVIWVNVQKVGKHYKINFMFDIALLARRRYFILINTSLKPWAVMDNLQYYLQLLFAIKSHHVTAMRGLCGRRSLRGALVGSWTVFCAPLLSCFSATTKILAEKHRERVKVVRKKLPGGETCWWKRESLCSSTLASPFRGRRGYGLVTSCDCPWK